MVLLSNKYTIKGGVMYSEHELVCIAKRDNNSKRSYLVVNRLQGKHIPVEASKAFLMFNELALQLKRTYKDEKLLVIGFAETATAIGSAISEVLDCFYIHTTREELPGVDFLYFSEDHSHAAQQKLAAGEIDRLEGCIDRVIFVEDEITTGNTILNIIKLLKKHYPWIRRYSAASILNGMNCKDLLTYESNKIQLHYLVKTDNSHYHTEAERCDAGGRYFICTDFNDVSDDNLNNDLNKVFKDYNFNEYKFNILPVNPRKLVHSRDYTAAVNLLWENIKKDIELSRFNTVLVLGTEEFMYPALFTAKKLEESGISTRCHSTTRSPINVSGNADYPFHTRYELKSFYDSNRITYIYNIDKYDCVLIITDSSGNLQQGVKSLVQALAINGITTIYMVRWC